jgi:hypothetical protein
MTKVSSMGDNCWIMTHSGRRVDLLTPKAVQISIEDVAHGLSMLCRFTGQIDRFYSVAEHSLILSQQFREPAVAMCALLHDASEAYIGDVSTPLKQVLGDVYKSIEYRLRLVICEALGLFDGPGLVGGDIRLNVKDMEKRLFINELDLFGKVGRTRMLNVYGSQCERLPRVELHCYTPDRIEYLYTMAYNYLLDMLKD